MNMYLVHNLGKLTNKVFEELYKVNGHEALTEELINKSLYQGMHNFCSMDLDLEGYYSWGSKDLGETTRGRFTGYSVELNIDNNPATYLLTGFYCQDDVELRDAYYRKALKQLSSMAHELRHAKQLESGILDNYEYINGAEDFDAYFNQDIEIDARRYQEEIFDNEEIFVELMFRLENRLN